MNGMDRVVAVMSEYLQQASEQVLTWATNPSFYGQVAMVVTGLVSAYFAARLCLRRVSFFQSEPSEGRLYPLRLILFSLGSQLRLIALVLVLGIATFIADSLFDQSWLIKVAQSIAMIVLFYNLTQRFISSAFIRGLFKWVLIPIAVLKVFGWMDDVASVLDGVSIQLGHIRLSALAIARGLIFGSILFWAGRSSNAAGQKAIRNQQSLDIGTRELLAKLFEIALYVVLFILLLQVIGINLTTLAVFGGAVGVGLGFGLQQIAANFISGIIILIDRSITVGDNVEIEGRPLGIVREIRMRYSVIETYAGKEIMVPNQTFISDAFVNWSHKDNKQRYDFTFSVAYSTDLHKLFDIVRDVLSSHPQVISGDDAPVEERPDAEIDSFGDSGVNILVEFWMEGIDDGRNRVDADLKLMIWDALRENNIAMPFPQREVRILPDKGATDK